MKVREGDNALIDRTSQIMSMHSEGKTLKEIGDHFGISKSRTQQIIQKIEARAQMAEASGYVGNDEPLYKLGLGTRTINALDRAGFKTVGQLIEYAANDEALLHIRNMGPLARDELRRKLKQHGRLTE